VSPEPRWGVNNTLVQAAPGGPQTSLLQMVAPDLRYGILNDILILICNIRMNSAWEISEGRAQRPGLSPSISLKHILRAVPPIPFCSNTRYL
jgi:hypothetical protein